MAKNISMMMKDVNPQSQELKQILTCTKRKAYLCIYSVVKVMKT